MDSVSSIRQFPSKRRIWRTTRRVWMPRVIAAALALLVGFAASYFLETAALASNWEPHSAKRFVLGLPILLGLAIAFFTMLPLQPWTFRKLLLVNALFFAGVAHILLFIASPQHSLLNAFAILCGGAFGGVLTVASRAAFYKSARTWRLRFHDRKANFS